MIAVGMYGQLVVHGQEFNTKPAYLPPYLYTSSYLFLVPWHVYENIAAITKAKHKKIR